MWCDAMQRGTMQYDAVRRDTTRYDAIQRGTTRRNMRRHDTTRYDTIRHDTIRYGTIRRDAIRYGTIRRDAIRYEAIQDDAMRSKITQSEMIQSEPTRESEELLLRLRDKALGSIWSLVATDMYLYTLNRLTKPYRSPGKCSAETQTPKPSWTSRLANLSRISWSDQVYDVGTRGPKPSRISELATRPGYPGWEG